jgi:radical SAM superfamily enzyme YgiQ (UPF0313 family)
MSFCLVSAPFANEFRDQDALAADENERIPLGVLCLASILEERGVTADVVNVDMLYSAWLSREVSTCESDDFATYAAARLASQDVGFFGFSSICSSYPLTLRIVTALKQRRPDVHVILGGPQATAAAEETLKAFPSVDVVVRGEGETILPALLDTLSTKENLRFLRGISYRSGRNVIRNPDAPLLKDLDSLPLPAFHLYSHLKEFAFLPLEIGRGCPFSCTFCSTSQFFRRSYRLKSAKRVVQQMMGLKQTYGICSFSLVHDNFTVDRKRVVAFCEALLSSGAKLIWTCSARTDCIDDDLIDLMRRAGCRGIFLGIESGSARMQEVIQKRLDIEAARERIRHTDRRKVGATVSMITGFPEETGEDLGETVHFFVDALRYDYVDPQLTLLSPLTGTPIHQRHQHELVFDDVISNMAFQGLEQDAQERELIVAHPAVFSSFYSVPTLWLDRQSLHELRHFLVNARFHFRWLLVAIHEATGDILEVFAAWRAWRADFGLAGAYPQLVAYYSGPEFRRDFRMFVQEELAKHKPAIAHVLLALADYQASIESGGEEADPPAESMQSVGALTDMHARPSHAANIRVTRLNADYSRIIRCLRRQERLSQVPQQESTVVTRYRKGRTEIIQLSPQSAKLLALCDGTRQVQQILQAFASDQRSVNGVPSEKACLVGLELLRQQGLLRVLPRVYATDAKSPPPKHICC